MSRTNGRPEPEVIVNFADGLAYAKAKMEDAFRPGGVLEKPYKAIKDTSSAKREDVDLIVHELEIPRAKAEKALVANGGDLSKTLEQLVA